MSRHRVASIDDRLSNGRWTNTAMTRRSARTAEHSPQPGAANHWPPRPQALIRHLGYNGSAIGRVESPLSRGATRVVTACRSTRLADWAYTVNCVRLGLWEPRRDAKTMLIATSFIELLRPSYHHQQQQQLLSTHSSIILRSRIQGNIFAQRRDIFMAFFMVDSTANEYRDEWKRFQLINVSAKNTIKQAKLIATYPDPIPYRQRIALQVQYVF